MRFNDVGMKAILMAGVLFLLLLLPLFVIEAAATEGGLAQELVSEVSQEKWAAGAIAGGEPLLQEADPELVEGSLAVAPLTVTAIGPSANEVGVALSAPITVTFDDDLDVSTVTSSTFVVHGQMSGLMTGTYSYDGPSKTLTFDPHEPFKAGEAIAVTLNDGILATNGTPLPPYQWQFTAGLTTARCVAGFSEIGAGLTGVRNSSVAWGDYDKDGDLDILLTGWDNGNYVAKVYDNDNGTFTDISAGLTGVNQGSVAWGDYDNDGDLDILLTGYDNGSGVAKVYDNDNGAFTDISANLTSVYHSSVAWGDYDNDGDLDILLTGYNNGTRGVAKVYDNDNGAFNEISTNLTGVWESSVAWGDYDNDGDLDILLTGYYNHSGTYLAKVYSNDNGTFNEISTNLTGVWASSVAWGDYDNDGDLDILLTGQDNSGTRLAKVYHNENGTFTDILANLTPVYRSSVAWGDYDNDGDLDILLTGSGISKVYRNENGTFSDLSANLTGVDASSVAWGDYDLDGDLDILLTGSGISKVYKNEACPIITLPGGALDYTENASATIIDAAATVSDDDSPDFDTGTLTVDYEANGTADDRLDIRNQGTGAGQIGVTNDTVTFGGTQIGTFTGGSGTTPLVITFNSNSSLASAQALMRNLRYHNVSDAPSIAPRTLRMVLNDGDGSTSQPATKTINVTAVNDAPILDKNGDPTLSAINEDVASASNNGTLVSALIASGAGGNPISDPDSGALEGLAVTAVDNSDGTWQFDAAGGTNWSAFNAPANDSATLLAPSATIRFVPNANVNGTASITFRAWDQTSGNNGDTAVDTSSNGGSSAFSSATESATITVNPINDSPTGGNDSVTTPEDTPETFAGSDFTFNDVDGHSFNAIRIETLETAGDLEENGVNVRVGEVIQDVTTLIFTPAANANGTAYATFTFRLRDSSGAESAQAYTMTINVTARNDAPTGGDESVTTTEDQNKSFSGSDFTFNDVDQHTFNGIRIESLETAGDLVAYGEHVSVTQIITDVTELVFTPELNQNGAAYATFTFKVRDSSGELSANDYTMTINVTAVNDPPTSANGSVTTPEDVAYTFDGNDITFDDVDGHSFNAIRIESLETAGDLEENGSDVGAGEVIEDVTNLVFTPAPNGNGTPYATFTFKVRDSSGALSANDYTMTINVTAIDDSPTSVSISGPQTGDIDTDYTFTATVMPQSTELPITYTWEATGQAPIIRTTNSLNHSVNLNWQTNGLKTITVTAANSSGSVTASRQIQIGNIPPEAREVTLSGVEVDEGSGLPEEGTAITVDYTYHDPDGNTEQGTLIRWARGGQFELQEQPKFNEKTSIPSEITIAEERWCVTVTPYDGQDYGEPIELCAYIKNVPNLLPTAEGTIREELTSSDPLTFTYTYDDPDGGQVRSEGPGEVRWYRDGVLQSKFNNNDDVSQKDTKAGEVWCGVVRPYDDQGFGPISPPKCTIISPPGALLPQINAEIRPEEPSDDEDLTIHTSPIGSADSRDQESAQLACDENALHIRWFRKGQLQPDLKNSCTVSSDLTQPGDKWWATVQPHNQFGNGRLVLTKPVYVLASESDPDPDPDPEVVNTPPVVTEVKITPRNPEDDETLFLNYEYFDADGHRERDTLIRWYKDLQHIELYNGLSAIPSRETSAGEVWHAVVTPNDGQVDGEQVAADSVVIGAGNSPPEVLFAYLSPGRPGDAQDLKLRYRYYDADGDLEGPSEIRWTANGDPKPAYDNRTVVPATDTTVGEEWCAKVTPYDLKVIGGQLVSLQGDEVASNCVTIQQDGRNTAPEARDAHIVPAHSSSSGDLELKYNYFDVDGDPEVDTMIFWYRNNALQIDFNNITLVPASEIAPGEEWYALVLVHDGTHYGTKLTTPAITINKPPKITQANLLPSRATQDQDLMVEYDYVDEDRDPDNSKILWYKNGSYQPEHNNRRTIPSQALTQGQRWYAVVTASDGYEETDVITTTETTIWCSQDAFSCLYLPLILRAPEVQPITPTPTLTPSPTATFTPTPTPTPTPSIGDEDNDTQETAQGQLISAQEYKAYPEDEDDWYYFIMTETGPAEIEVTNYRADDGQVVLYQEYFDRNNSPQREVIDNDGRGGVTMKMPNELDPHALSNLSPGKYLVLIRTEEPYRDDEQYRLTARYRFK